MQLTPEQQAIGEIMIERAELRRQIGIINLDRQQELTTIETAYQAACQTVNANHDSEIEPLKAQVDIMSAQLRGEAPIEG